MKHRLLLAALLLGCAAPTADITVSEPKVFGDDQVLRGMAERLRALRRAAPHVEGSELQEVFDVRHDAARRTTLGVNLADPLRALDPRPPGARRGLRPGARRGRRGFAPPPRPAQPLPGLGVAGRLQKEIERGQLLSAYELLYLGDVTLLDRNTRVALVRFEVSFNNYLDLGSRRRFAVVKFRVQGKRKRAPRFKVYLLSPEYSSMVGRESLTDSLVKEYAAQLLGSWGGIGVSAARGASDRLRRRFLSVLHTPLQFAIYTSRGGGRDFTFAFAFGPRRRLEERSLLDPARWFGSPYEIAYEVQPGPRSCHALLVFPNAARRAPVELQVSASYDGQLIAAEEVRIALGRRHPRRSTFTVTCPPAARRRSGRTREVEVVPQAASDVLLVSGEGGPTFSADSAVFVGNAAIPRRDVRLLGRGRLAVRVRPRASLRALLQGGRRATTGRVLTPDQAEFRFKVKLLSLKRGK